MVGFALLKSLMLLLVLPFVSAQTDLDGLMNYLPDVAALKRMCATVKIMQQTAQNGASSSSDVSVEEGDEDDSGSKMDLNKWLDQAKPVCQQVENMKEEDMKSFLEEQKKKHLKARAEKLKENCAAIDEASKNDKLEWFEQQAFYKDLKVLCDRIKKEPEKIDEIMKELQEKARSNMTGILNMTGGGNMSMSQFMTPESLERGCKTIEEAKNNNKIDWFEQAPWYSKAKELCNGLKQAVNTTFHTPEKDLVKEVKNICAELDKELIKTMLAKGDDNFLSKAQNLCKEIKDKSDEEAKKYLQEHGNTLKELGLGKVTEACSKLSTLPDVLKTQEWYKSLDGLCTKITSNEISTDGIAKLLNQQCQEYAKKSDAELAEESKKDPKAAGVIKACQFIKSQDGDMTILKGRRLRGVASPAFETVFM